MNGIPNGKTAAGSGKKELVLRVAQKHLSLQSLMMIIAVCACFFPMLSGMSGLMAYKGSKWQEAGYRDDAAFFQGLKEGGKIAPAWEQAAVESERIADLAASNARKHWDLFATAVALIGLGMISGGLAITLRVWYGPEISTRSRPAYYLFSTCSTLAVVLLVAFGIAACLQLFAYARLYTLGRL